MKKIITVIITLALIVTLMGCNTNNQSTPAPTKKPVPTPVNYTVVDSRGKSVNFRKIPQKIISLLPSDTEIIYALGDGAKLTAVSTYCNYPSDTKNKKKMDSGNKMNIETIIGMTPDVVFLGQMAQTEAQFKQLEDAGIKLVVTEAGNINDTYKVISIIGKALQKETKSNTIINNMKSEFAAIKTKAASNAKVRIYVEVSPLQYGLWTCGRGTFQDELINMIGAENIFSNLSSWAEVSEEVVLSKNPQFIFTTMSALEGMPDPVAEIKGRANWGIVDAVKNNKVFTADSDAFTRPGPRLVDAAKYLMNKVYGK